ncbi:MAG: hypothetical protein IPH31_12100 [Lewinellaceae bacterium]|nr:hypothetical protein [Lewinellaceae bacterium]
MTRTISVSSTGFLEVVLCVLLLFGITMFFPMYFKTWFVEATGNIKIAPFFGFLFGVGLLFRKQWARTGAIVLGWGLLAIFIVSIITEPGRSGYWLVLALDGFLLYLLHNERLKQYFQ